MKDNYYKEFDSELRSLLSEAEEEVPGHVWEGVRSAMVRKRRIALWSRCGIAAAAAAAVALLLTVGLRPSVPASADAGDLVAEAVTVPSEASDPVAGDAASVSEAVPVAQSLQAVAPAAAARPRTVRTSVPVSPGPDGPSLAETVAEVPVEVSTETAVEAPAPAQEEKAAGESRNAPASHVDLFARMDYEDALKGRSEGVRLEMKGLMGTNDAISSAAGRYSRMGAQSVSSTFTGASEDGESVYDIPFSAGVGVRIPLGGKWSLGTGVTYSRLGRTFDGVFYENGSPVSGPVASLRHTVQYVGIPANLYYELLSGNRLGMYAFAGASVEKGFGQTFTSSAVGQTWKLPVEGLQGSAALGLGVRFRLGQRVGLYLDPSVRYYFGKNQPRTIRTQQPFMFNMELGVSFELGNSNLH